MKDWYLKQKYGLYLTIAYEGFNLPYDPTNRYELTVGSPCVFSGGRQPRDINDLADSFDVPRFIQDCVDMKVEYINLTLYHAHCYTLGPNETLEKLLPGHTAKRDLAREILDGLHAHGIKLQFYMHATIGDSATDHERDVLGYNDSTDHYKRWNDFINAFFGEIAARYPDVDSFYLDMIFDQPFVDMIDKKRLYQTLTRENPNVVITGNGEANEAVDVGSRENHQLHALCTQSALDIAPIWWATIPNVWVNLIPGFTVAKFKPAELYRLLAMNAGANTEGGGIAFGCGPYCDAGFEPGIKETLVELGSLIESVAESIKQTYPSTSYITPAGISIDQLPCGISATRSADDRYEYIHVLTQPEGNTLQLPAPLDGKTFSDPVVLASDKQVQLVQNEQGVRLTVEGGWNEMDTVIRLAAEKAPAENRKSSAIDPSHMTAFCEGDLPEHPASLVLDGNPDTFWRARHTSTEEFPFIRLTLDREYCLTGVRILPRQDGNTYKELCNHISMYSIYVSTDGKNYRAVATGELKRSLEEKRICFSPVQASYIKVSAVPDWMEDDLPLEQRNPISAANIIVEAVEE